MSTHEHSDKARMPERPPVDRHQRYWPVLLVVVCASVALNWLLLFGAGFPWLGTPLSWPPVSLDPRLFGAAALVVMAAVAAHRFYLQKRAAEIRLAFELSQAEGRRIESALKGEDRTDRLFLS